MAQMPALIPKEVEIQRLKKVWLIVIAMGSTAASVEVDNFVDGSLHQTSIRDSAFHSSTLVVVFTLYYITTWMGSSSNL